MSYTESELECDDCGSNIPNEEECYCGRCFGNAQNKIEELLTESKDNLLDKIDELENKISELESKTSELESISINVGLEEIE